jgi:nicotinamidase-related amidase
MKKITFFIVTMLLLAGSINLFSQDKKSVRMRPALLVIDIQNQFMPMMDEAEKDIAMYAINVYIDLFRKSGFPVVRVYHSDKEYGPFPGTPEFEFPEEVTILPDDPKVIKTYGNGFNKTDLEKVLRDKGVNTLFLCGLSSVGCVLATWMGAQDLDFKAFLLKDAMMSHNADYTNSIEEIFDALGYETVQVMLDNAEK